MKRAARIAALVAGAVLLVALCWWLRMPASLALLARTLGDARHPVAFSYTFTGPEAPLDADVEATYIARTPILGISRHYWSIIAPPSVDTRIVKPEVVRSATGMRFSLPLGIAGLSGFRLAYVALRRSGGELPDVSLQPTGNGAAPPQQTIPFASLFGGAYAFDGPFALWATSGGAAFDDGYAYSTRAVMSARDVIWDGLRSVTARIDFTPYPLPAFEPGTTWTGKIARGTQAFVPYAPDCALPPELFAIRAADVPEWSKVQGLWRPIPLARWKAFAAASHGAPLALRFVRRIAPPTDPKAASEVEVRGSQPGRFRLFAACPAAHYDTVAVTWLDVEVR